MRADWREDWEWFIDAWSVIDGYAFASLRRPESLDAHATFFVAPPYFAPEPVASLATALAATRTHFQEGFRADGVEVAFPSLEHVVEAVRRAYRAGGLDIDGTPAPLAPRPREPGGGGEVHPEDLVSHRMRSTLERLRIVLIEETGGEVRRQSVEELLVPLIEATFEALVPKFVETSIREMVLRLVYLESGRNSAARELHGWIDKAHQLGIDVTLDRDHRRIVAAVRGAKSGFQVIVPELDSLPDVFFPVHPIVYRSSGALVSEFRIPFTVPIPEVFQPAAGAAGYPVAPTLGHLLAVASADRRYLHTLGEVPSFVPLIVAALIQLPPESLPHFGFPPTQQSPEIRAISEQAARWLAQTLPSGMLAQHPAEQAIHDLVVRLLPRPPAGRGSTPIVPPVQSDRYRGVEPDRQWGIAEA